MEANQVLCRETGLLTIALGVEFARSNPELALDEVRYIVAEKK